MYKILQPITKTDCVHTSKCPYAQVHTQHKIQQYNYKWTSYINRQCHTDIMVQPIYQEYGAFGGSGHGF